MTSTNLDKKYLRLLAEKFPNIQSASTEIINLQAILDLPKATEHFMSDLHGEYDAFIHILNNGSGVIRDKIDILFKDHYSEQERSELATLIYYPEEKSRQLTKHLSEKEKQLWYHNTLLHLVDVCRYTSTKYSRSKVRKAYPKDFAYIIDELLSTQEDVSNRKAYYDRIISSIIDLNRAQPFIEAICDVIKRLAVDRLHIVGDIYDRGPGPHIIVNKLMEHHSVDIQWGNHDILWMGSAAGCACSIMGLLATTARYNNLDIVEDGYGINLRPLSNFAEETYSYSEAYAPKFIEEGQSQKDIDLCTRMHKAVAVMMYKLEGQIIKRHPEFQMDHRLLLHKIDYKNKSITIDGVSYPLKDCNFPTINLEDPYALSREEQKIIDHLVYAFTHSELLQKHTKYLFSVGSLYKVVNSNVLYHACIPMTKEGEFASVTLRGETHSGKAYMDHCERIIRRAYFETEDQEAKKDCLDHMWYWWCGEHSPLFGKRKMTTFERVLIAEKEAWHEPLNHYYSFIAEEEVCNKIFEEFQVDHKKAHVINGHMPVKLLRGETPIKANGKLVVIDGGFSKMYQPKTGIAGYTLIFNSYGLRLSAHEPFESTEKAILNNQDIYSKTEVFEEMPTRLKILNTDVGLELQEQIDDLKALLKAYNQGLIKQKY